MLDNEYDIVYIDPPYNNRQYGANYGFLNIIAGLEDFEIYGKTGLVKNYNKSKFSSRKTVKSQFESLINKIRAKYIIVSYSNEGIISYQELLNIFNKKGDCKVYQIPHYKFISNSVKDKNKIIEYLFLIKKSEYIIYMLDSQEFSPIASSSEKKNYLQKDVIIDAEKQKENQVLEKNLIHYHHLIIIIIT